MGKIKDILQLLVAWQDVVIQLLSDTFLFELKIPGLLSSLSSCSHLNVFQTASSHP